MKNFLSKELIKGRGYNFANTTGFLPNNIIGRNANISYEKLADMRNDPHIWSCIQSRKSGVLSQNYTINFKGSQLDEAIKEFTTHSDNFKLFSYCLDAILFGFQAFEIIWEQSNGAIIPNKLIPKSQDWFAFDHAGKLKLINGDEIPEYKVIYIRYSPDSYNPYGTSALGKCYWSLTFKNAALKYWTNYMEKYGVPIVLAQYNRSAHHQEAENLLSSLQDMAEDNVIVAPNDITLDFKEANREGSVALYKEMISHCNAEISKAILSQNLTTEVTIGSKAASETHYKIRKEIIEADTLLLNSFFSRLMRYIFSVNKVELSQVPELVWDLG